MKNTLALCIPAYNAAWCLPRLLESAFKQTIAFDEILVYDDCSTDNTAEIAESYGAKVITGLKNEGCSYGKNKLAENCTSNWLHFHDADDILLPNFTEVAHNWINKQSQPDIVLLNFEYKDFNSNEFLDKLNYNRNELIADPIKFVLTNKIVNFALCKKSSFLAINGFDLDKKVLYNEDRAFYIRAVIAGLKFDYEPIVTSINYRYQQSMSASNALKCASAVFHVYQKTASKVDRKYSIYIANNLWQNATIAASMLDWDLTKDNIKLAISLGGRIPTNGNVFFKYICAISPFSIYWIRERLIRFLKPDLRKQ